MGRYTGYDYLDKVGNIVVDTALPCYDDASVNIFHGDITGYYNQCTWYAYGRAYERYGGPIIVSGSAHKWYDTINETVGVIKLSKSEEPISKSIAVFSDSGYGHVVFIEQVDNHKVYFTEGNSWCADGTVQVKELDVFRKLWSKQLEGYIALEKFHPL